MPLYRQVGLTSNSAPFVFVDIDQDTYVQWGHPPIVPRGKLAKLVANALSFEPSILIVDVDLGFPSCDDESNELIIANIDATIAGTTTNVVLFQSMAAADAATDSEMS
jgi:hypothetical protein